MSTSTVTAPSSSALVDGTGGRSVLVKQSGKSGPPYREVVVDVVDEVEDGAVDVTYFRDGDEPEIPPEAIAPDGAKALKELQAWQKKSSRMSMFSRKKVADAPAAGAPAPAPSLSLPGLALSAAPAPADDEPAKPKKAARPARRNFMAGVVRAAGERASGKKLTEDSLSEAIRGFISYAVFLFIFVVVCFSTRSSDDFWANEGMKNLFVHAAFHFGHVTHEKTLADVRSVPQFFSWLRGPFIDTVYLPELGGEPLYLHGYNRLIGRVRLRQVRVTPGSCEVPEMFATLIDGCWGPYTLGLHDDEPFGPEYEPTRWRHSDVDDTDDFLANGRFATYSGGGHVVDLPLEIGAAREAAAALQQHGWVDRATRAVFIDFSCFNANSGMLFSVRLLFEFLPSGGIMPMPTLRVLKPLLYVEPMDFARAVFEVAFILYVLQFIVQEGREVLTSRREGKLKEYWSDTWNILDWINVTLFIAVIALRIYTLEHTCAEGRASDTGRTAHASTASHTHTASSLSPPASSSLYHRYRVLAQIDGMGSSSDEYINLQPLMWQLQQVQ